MSRPPAFDDSALKALGIGARVPATFDRAGRVRLLGEFAEAALSGREPSRESVLFVAGAISAWLANGGDIARDYLRVTAKAGSHHTPAAVWQTLQEDSSRGAQKPENPVTLPASSSNTESKK